MSVPDSPRQRRVCLVGLGGTIAMTVSGDQGARPALAPDELLAAVPGLAQTGIAVDPVDLRRLPGASVSFADLRAAGQVIGEQLAGGAAGIVLVQGTDTIEETSYLLDLIHPGPQPIVVTGAMRNSSLAGADGPANLLAAVQVAADPAWRDQGALVVMGDEIHAARRVCKAHTSSPAAFSSPTGGPLGYLVEGRPAQLSRLGYRTVAPFPPTERQPRVAVLPVALGDDGELLAGLADRLDGLVVAGFGGGHVPADLVAPLAAVAEQIPVVLASRTRSGSVMATSYGFPGSERDLLARGLISAGFLDPFKARILLYVVLAAAATPEQVRAAFGAAGGYADPAGWPWPAP